MRIAERSRQSPDPVAARPSLADLTRRSIETRRLILQSVANAGAGHVGGPLSVADLLVNLYFDRLRIDPANPRWPERDRFILSKGHSSIALYTVLALRGYFPVAELQTFDALNSRLQGHPDMTVLPGLDMSTGSLGQGLSPGVGMALGARLRDQAFHTWVILGDGELQEGQIWEAAFTGARYGLDNLTAIVDSNGLPQFGWPDRSGLTRAVPIDDPAAKFRAFGWHAIECDGHDHAAIRQAFDAALAHAGQPTCIVAHTAKGKGISFTEGDYLWHAKVPTAADLEAANAELDAQLAALEDTR
ncbi:MAG TPA: transketolase [Thermomicrobiales bacterium]|nr:transketolase [Thermomicrobiales bacterium]